MWIIGCDFHPRFQQIAFVNAETGEYGATGEIPISGTAAIFLSTSQTPSRTTHYPDHGSFHGAAPLVGAFAFGS